MMLHCGKSVQFIFPMTVINKSNNKGAKAGGCQAQVVW